MPQKSASPDNLGDKGSKSIRRFNSPFNNRKIALKYSRTAESQRRVFDSRSHRLLGTYPVAEDAERSLNSVQSLIAKGKDLLNAVSKQEKNVKYEVESQLRSERLRNGYVDQLLNAATSFTSKSESLLKEGPGRSEPDVFSESDDSIIVLSDEESESPIHTSRQIDAYEPAENFPNENPSPNSSTRSLSIEKGDENENMYSERSDTGDGGELSAVTDSELQYGEEQSEDDLESNELEASSQPGQFYMQAPVKSAEVYHRAEHRSSTDTHSNQSEDEVLAGADESDSREETTLYSGIEGVRSEESINEDYERLETFQDQHSMEPKESESDGMFSIAQQALQQLGHSDYMDIDSDQQSNARNDNELKYSDVDLQQEATDGSPDIDSDKYDDDPREIPSDENIQPVRSDGLGELGEYSYNTQADNTTYGLVVDNDHSVVVKEYNETEVATDSHIEVENDRRKSLCDEPEFNEYGATPVLEPSKTIIPSETENVNIQVTKYSITYSGTYSDDEMPTRLSTGTTEEKTYHSAFDSDPFDSHETDEEDQRRSVAQLLDALGLHKEIDTESFPCEQNGTEIEINNPSVDKKSDVTTAPLDMPQESNISVASADEVIFFDAEDHEMVDFKEDAVLDPPADLSPPKVAQKILSQNELNSPEDGKINIPLFIDAETIRLTTSPVRATLSSDSDDDANEVSFDYQATERIKLNTLSSTLKKDPLSRTDLAPEDKELPSDQEYPLPPVFRMSSSIKNSALPYNDDALRNSTKEFHVGSPEFLGHDALNSSIQTDTMKEVEETPDFGTGAEQSNDPLQPSASHSAAENHDTTTEHSELTDYVSSVLRKEPAPVIQSSQNYDSGTIIADSERRTSTIVVEELPSVRNFNEESVQLITTVPEILLNSSPEHEIDSVLIQQSETSNDVEIIYDVSDRPSPGSNESEDDGIVDSLTDLMQVDWKATPNNQKGQEGSQDCMADTNTAIAETEKLVSAKTNKQLGGASEQTAARGSEFSSLTNANSSVPNSVVSSNTFSKTTQLPGIPDERDIHPQNALESETHEDSTEEKAADASPRPSSFSRRVLSSPLKMFTDFAHSIRELGEAAAEFVNTADVLAAESESSSEDDFKEGELTRHMVPSRKVYSKVDNETSDTTAVVSETAQFSKGISPTSQPELKSKSSYRIEGRASDLKEEIDIEKFLKTGIAIVENSSKPHKVDHSRNAPTDDTVVENVNIIEQSSDPTQVLQGSNMMETSDNAIVSTPPSESSTAAVIVDSVTELSLSNDSELKPLFQPSGNDTEEEQFFTNSSGPESIPVLVQAKPAEVIPITVHTEIREPPVETKRAQLNERTPVKKRPRSTDTETNLKPSKKKHNKKKRQGKKVKSVTRNLRPKR